MAYRQPPKTTMAFTHEESLELGPYFSRREWVEDQPPGHPRRRR